jgi:hypothetical protein
MRPTRARALRRAPRGEVLIDLSRVAARETVPRAFTMAANARPKGHYAAASCAPGVPRKAARRPL